jgi:exosortase/archaeosortase family protein
MTRSSGIFLAATALPVWLHAAPRGEWLDLLGPSALSGAAFLALLPSFRTAPRALEGDRIPLAGGLALIASLLLPIGAVAAAIWCLLARRLLSVRLTPSERGRLERALPFAFLAFPWVPGDLEFIGWWFRLSGSWTAGTAFEAAGWNVERQGTLLSLDGLRLSVSEACSGLRGLYLFLVGGAWIFERRFAGRGWFAVGILFAFAGAWIANTVRIIALGGVAVWFGPWLATGAFHEWFGAGAVALCAAALAAALPRRIRA